MIKIGITGQSGFIGTHLFNKLKLHPDKYIIVEFNDEFFEKKELLEQFVKSCDVIIHLAAMNRHQSQDVIYKTNLDLVRKLINACELSDSRPGIIFSSSIQEEKENLYGKSKKEGRLLLEDWAKRSIGKFLGLVIPNVFGPFGKPYYNSVVATFCHQLNNNETPTIDIDGELKLIYIDELVEWIKKCIDRIHEVETNRPFVNIDYVPYSSSIKVSSLLTKLKGYFDDYIENGVIPDLSNPFDRNLFNTYVSFIDYNTKFPFYLKQNKDNRGSFVEVLKSNSRGQFSFSTTKPGITRGNHFHTRKVERFAVIKGKARIDIRRIGKVEVQSFELDGSNPSFVDMPIWYTHNITNIGNEDLYTLFWISEFYDPDDSDTYYEVV
jgi:UDP-2-acetamido-2,6-beta-L-arabino-hexul-4-ose reductase